MKRYSNKWKIIAPLLFAASLLFAGETTTLDIPVTQDMEETLANGKMRNDATLDLGHDRTREQLTGLRFAKVAIPQGARIKEAWLEFTAKKNAEGDADFTILTEESDNAAVLKRKRYNLSSRTLLQTEIQWSGVENWERNQKYRSKDLTPLIQELVEQEGWEEGNAILLLIKPGESCKADQCQRMAKARRGHHRNATLLHIAYKPKKEGPGKEPIVETPPHNWYMRLVAEDPARGLKAGDAQLGQLEAEDATSKHSLHSFGHFGKNYLDIVFEDPEGIEAGDYKSNFHSYQNTEDRWRFTVQTNDSAAEIILSWRGIYVLEPYIDTAGRTRYKEYRSLSNPLGAAMKLIDTATGEEVPAFIDGKAQLYTFSMDGQTSKTFEWVAQEVPEPQPTATMAAQSTEQTDALSQSSSTKSSGPRARSLGRSISPAQLSALKARAMRMDAKRMQRKIREERAKGFDLGRPPVGERRR